MADAKPHGRAAMTQVEVRHDTTQDFGLHELLPNMHNCVPLYRSTHAGEKL